MPKGGSAPQSQHPVKSTMENSFNAMKRFSFMARQWSKSSCQAEEGAENNGGRINHHNHTKRLSLCLNYAKSAGSSPLAEEPPTNPNHRQSLSSPNSKRGSLFNCNVPSLTTLKGQIRKSVGRLVNKDGSYHVEHVHPAHGWIGNFRSTFPFLLEIKWRWIIVGIGLCFPVSWFVFALLYYAIAHGNGDFQQQEYNNESNSNQSPDSTTIHKTCIANVESFEEIFLFSVESQMTVGYGFRYPNPVCPVLWVILSLQYVVGAILQGCICGIIWARLLRPKRRGQEVVFSEHAVINQDKEGRLCLMFRLSDIAGNNLVNANVRMFIAEKRKAWILSQQQRADDDLFSFRLLRLNLQQDEILLLWPSVVTHVIDAASPLYDYSKADLERADFELIVTVGGVVESTGLTVETRTSYLANEILWGRRFHPMTFIGLHKSKVKVHYLEFGNTYFVETPIISAKKLDELLKGTKPL